MSKVNRKNVYDKLVAKGKEIPPSLSFEFAPAKIVKKEKKKKDGEKE